MLAARIIGEVIGKLICERFAAPLFDMVEVGCTQLKAILIRGDCTVAAHGHGLVVNLTFQCAG